MLSCHTLEKFHPNIWRELVPFFNGQGMLPCLFAMASFNKKMTSFIVVDKFEKITNSLIKNLPEFNKKIQSEKTLVGKTYRTIILICLESIDYSFDEAEFINHLLISLNAKDKHQWPHDKTRSFNEQDFEFYWGGVQWFPVLLHPKHTVEIRQSPFFMVAFQAGLVFDFNKKNRPEFYEKMRASIHSRIKKKYRSSPPFYLSDNSSGKNICQYSGLDKKEFDYSYEYPELPKI